MRSADGSKKSLWESASEVLRLYYYGCSLLGERKSDPEYELRGHAIGDPGVLFSECPDALFAHVGSSVASAQCLYASWLSSPLNDIVECLILVEDVAAPTIGIVDVVDVC